MADLEIIDFHTHLDDRWFDQPLLSEPDFIAGLDRCGIDIACVFTLMGFWGDRVGTGVGEAGLFLSAATMEEIKRAFEDIRARPQVAFRRADIVVPREQPRQVWLHHLLDREHAQLAEHEEPAGGRVNSGR